MCNSNGFGGGSCCWIIILIIILFCCCGGWVPTRGQSWYIWS